MIFLLADCLCEDYTQPQSRSPSLFRLHGSHALLDLGYTSNEQLCAVGYLLPKCYKSSAEYGVDDCSFWEST